jgi:glucose-1-phosphate thymidylyltransferase
MTPVVSKLLSPIDDKRMNQDGLTTPPAGGRDILANSTPADLPLFRRSPGDRPQRGVSLGRAESPRPDGLAQAYIVAAAPKPSARRELAITDPNASLSRAAN